MDDWTPDNESLKLVLQSPCLPPVIAAGCRKEPAKLRFFLDLCPESYEKLEANSTQDGDWQHAKALFPVFFPVLAVPLTYFLPPLNNDNVKDFYALVSEPTVPSARFIEFLRLASSLLLQCREDIDILNCAPSISHYEAFYCIWEEGLIEESMEGEFLCTLLGLAVSNDLQSLINSILSSGKIETSEQIVSIAISKRNISTLKCLTEHPLFPSNPKNSTIKKILKVIEDIPKSHENTRFQGKARDLITKAVKPKKQVKTPTKETIGPKKGKKSKKRKSNPRRVSYIDAPILPSNAVVVVAVPTKVENVKELVAKEEQKEDDAEMDRILLVTENKAIITSLLTSLPISNQTLDDSCYQLSKETTLDRTPKPSKARKQTLAPPVEEVAPVVIEEPEPEIEKNISDFVGKAWELTISNTAMKQWKKLDVSYNQLVRSTLIRLAEEGPKRGKPIKNPNTQGIHLFETDAHDGISIIWAKDIDFSDSKSDGTRVTYVDIIRILGIVKQSGMDSFIKQIANSQQRAITGKIRKTLIAIGNPIDGQPRCYRRKGEENHAPEENEEICIFPPAAFDKECFSIEKFYDVTDGLAKHAAKDEEKVGDFFRISEKEFQVISSSEGTATILLGRSGTGKTTCALAKMWSTYWGYWTACGVAEPLEAGRKVEENCHLHQVFVTANSLLRSEVDTSFQKMKKMNLSGEKARILMKHTADMTLPCHLNDDIALNEFPMFVTSRRWVIMVDGSLDNPFFSRKENQELQFEAFLYHPSQEVQRKNITLEGLNFIKNEEEDGTRDEGALCVEIDFQYFQETIWRKIIRGTVPKKLLPHYPCSLIWKEIHSYIKGSIALFTKTEQPGKKEPVLRNFLNREEYLNVGQKLAPNFMGDRNIVYDIFEAYQRYIAGEKWRKLFDWMDVIQHCIQQLLIKPYSGIPIHELFYDEVQDATQIELYLNFLIIKSPNQFFFTGDTCQTIARGVGFRFKDLRSIFHHYVDESRKAGLHLDVKVPEIQQLLLNYRSHRGITALAAAIVELLKYFFPASYDNMDPDEGIYPGPLPKVLRTNDVKYLFSVLGGGGEEGDPIELGANQVIIVRDQAAKKSVPAALRQGGLVMTVFECKGLEFNDVLVYNFFTDSPYAKEWKFIKKYRGSPSTQSTPTDRSSSSFSLRDDKKNIKEESNQFRSLCDELKYLYVIATRAKVNLCFFDSESCDTMNPIHDFFVERGLVESTKGTKNVFGNNTSTPAQWETMADSLMNKNIWGGAAFCYRRASKIKKYHYAMAKQIHQTAINLRNESGLDTEKMKEVNKTFFEAGKRFLMSDHYEDAALCFYTAKQVEFAIHSLRISGNNKVLSELYFSLKQYEKSAVSLLLIGAIKKAVMVLTKGGCYEKIGDVLVRAQAVNQMPWADIIKILIPRADTQGKVLNCNINNKELVNAIIPHMPKRFVKNLIRSCRDSPSLLASLEGIESLKAYQKEFRDHHLHHGNYAKALETSDRSQIQEYYKTLRGLLVNNLVAYSDAKHKQMIEKHMKLIMATDLNEQWRLFLGIAYAKWAKCEQEATYLHPRAIFFHCGPMGIFDYFSLRKEVNGENLLFQLDCITKICRNYLPVLLEAYGGSYTAANAIYLQMMEEYWMVNKHSSGYGVSTLSPMYDIIFNRKKNTKTCTVQPRTVLNFMILRLLHVLFSLKKDIQEPLQKNNPNSIQFPGFDKRLGSTSYNYDSFHYLVLKEYHTASDALDRFHENLESKNMIQRGERNSMRQSGQMRNSSRSFGISFETWEALPIERRLKNLLRTYLQKMYYPPPWPEFWMARNQQKHFLFSKVGFLIKEERDYRAGKKKKNLFKRNLSFNREYFLCQTDSTERETSLAPENCDNVDGAYLLAAEMCWHKWEMSSSFRRALIPLIKSSSKNFETMLNVLEIHVMRFIRIDPDGAFPELIVSECHFIKHFQHSSDLLVTTKEYINSQKSKINEAQASKFLKNERDSLLGVLVRVFDFLVSPPDGAFLFGDHDRIGLLLAILFYHLALRKLLKPFKMLITKFPLEKLVRTHKKNRDPIYSSDVMLVIENFVNYFTVRPQRAEILHLLDNAVFRMEGRRLVQVTQKPCPQTQEFKWYSETYITLEQKADLQWMTTYNNQKEAKALLEKFFIHYMKYKKESKKSYPIEDSNCPDCGKPFSLLWKVLRLVGGYGEEEDRDDDISQEGEFDHSQCTLNPKGEIRMIYHQTTVGHHIDLIEMNTPEDEIEIRLEEINEFISSKYFNSKCRVTAADVERFIELNEELKKQITQEDVPKPEPMNLLDGAVFTMGNVPAELG